MANGLPLSALLPDRLDSMAERVRGKLGEDEQARGMKLAWDYVGKQLHGALKSVLDVDIVEILAKAWAKSDALSGLADPTGHSPGERTLIELGEHEVSRELHPTVAVTITSCPCVELKFTLAVSAHVGGANLAIVDGHIVGGELGETWASAILSYDGVPLHSPAESSKVELPGEFALVSPGIPILGLAAVPPSKAGGAAAAI